MKLQGPSCPGFLAIPGLPKRIFLSRAATFTAVIAVATADSHSLQVSSCPQAVPLLAAVMLRQCLKVSCRCLQKRTVIKQKAAQHQGRKMMHSCKISVWTKDLWLSTKKTGCLAFTEG